MGELSTQEVIRGQFEILRELGSGTQGRTFLARDRESEKQVALKELSLQWAVDWKSVELFEREGLTLRSLRHPSIPGFVETFHLKDSSRFFLVQEWIAGENLQAAIDRKERMGEAQARALLEEMLGVLEYLHGLSPPVIHRDIKPSNIMRRAEEETHVLIDFGAVQALVYDEQGGSTVVGTSGYMPPEQLMGRACEASDLYGLAATIVHCVTGIHPAQLPMVRMRLQFRELASLSSGLTDILEKMLEPSLKARFENAGEVRAALESGLVVAAERNLPVPSRTSQEVSAELQALMQAQPISTRHSVIHIDHEKMTVTFPGVPVRKLPRLGSPGIFVVLGLAAGGCFLWPETMICTAIALLFVMIPLGASLLGTRAKVSQDQVLEVSKEGFRFLRVARYNGTDAYVQSGDIRIPFEDVKQIKIQGMTTQKSFWERELVFETVAGRKYRLGAGSGVRVDRRVPKETDLSWLKDVIATYARDSYGRDFEEG